MMTMTARDLMTADVLSVSDTLSMSELAAFLIENEITGAAVRDEEGELVGVVSVVDIASHVKERADIVGGLSRPDFYVRGWEETFNKHDLLEFHLESSELTVRDIMTPRVYSIPADASIADVAVEMLNAHIHRLLVTEDGDLVGIISTSDFLKLFVGREGPSRHAPTGDVTESLTPEARSSPPTAPPE